MKPTNILTAWLTEHPIPEGVDIAKHYSNVYLTEYKSSQALVQPLSDTKLLILYVLGKGLTEAHIQHLGYPVVLAEPKSKAHTRLYKRLGFKQDGEYLQWKM